MLNHWLAEQYYFEIRKSHNLIHSTDQVYLFNLTETVLWKELDRWNYYGDPDEPTAPSYSLYTGFTLKWTFGVFLVLMFFHLMAMLIVKTFTSVEFKEDDNNYSKLMHLMENIHCAVPYKDWDEDEGKSTTKEEFKRRFHYTKTEMILSQLLNIGVSIIMLIPIWFTCKYQLVQKIHILTIVRQTST